MPPRTLTAPDPDAATSDGPAAAGPSEVAVRGHRTPRHAYRLWFALPAIVLVGFFFALPFVANGFLAFTRWTGFSRVIAFNGLDNVRALLDLGILGHATAVTLAFAVVTMLVQNVVGLTLAKALRTSNRVNSFFRSLFFVPVLISPLAAGYIWAAALADDGPVNQALSVLLPGDVTYSWLGHATSALLLVGAIDGWKWSGLVTLVYIAGLNTIPRSVMEAAVLDGAGAWCQFRRIEAPLLAPSFTFNLVITLVGSFSALDVVFATTKGGPGDATTVLNAAVFAQYGQGLFGTSSALSFMIAVLVVLTAVPLLVWLRRREVHA